MIHQKEKIVVSPNVQERKIQEKLLLAMAVCPVIVHIIT